MPFPEASRVVYAKNPLDKVICQLRFPAILRIDAESPHQFQDSIRKLYPVLVENTPSVLEAQNSLAGIFPGFPQQIQINETKNYKFASEDEFTGVNLTRDFVALTSINYKSWDQFKGHLETPIEALFSTYEPSFITRVGLRYIDVFKRTEFGYTVEDPWNLFIESHLLGPLSDEEVASSIRGLDCAYEFELDDGVGVARVILRMVKDTVTDEECLLLDNDFFCSGKFNRDEVSEKLEKLHEKASRLLRWCITAKLHEALKPKELT